MALDFQQVYAKIKEIGASVQQRKKTLDERRAKARVLLNVYADALDVLREKLETVKAADPAIRCALPLKEALDSHLPPPELPLNATLIAADGSQINPDRHGQIHYGLVNVGAIVLQLNSGETTQIFTDSQLLFDEELFTASGNPVTEAMVALQRDLKERTKLDELAQDYPPPVITFTDGPIELWGFRDGEDATTYQESLKEYLAVLKHLQARGVTTAGYVDKPSADLVVRLLELVEAPQEELRRLREYHPMRGVSDRWLFGEKNNPLLKPGERSAVFGIQSTLEKYYKDGLSLCFFYLNAGTEGRPWPVRVEIPGWVADNAEKLGMLHAVLVAQCRMMGAKPYPYLLHRAHETAVVSNEEREQVEQMLMRELREQGGETDEGSYKQSAKDLPGKSSYRN
jgi:hypothetical protein